MTGRKSSTISPPRWSKLFFPAVIFLALFIFSGCDNACGANVSAFTWNDSNRNGIQDPGELPIENGAIDYSHNRFTWKYAPYFAGTDKQGKAVLMDPSFGSCPTYLSVTVRPLDGYSFTTSDTLEIGFSRNSTQTVSLDFGLAYDLPVTPTPMPSEHLECYPVPIVAGVDQIVNDAEFMPNGDIWMAVMGPQYSSMLMLKQEGKEPYQVEMAGVFSPHDLAQAPDGTLWVAGYGTNGVAHYGGESWQYYKPGSGLPFDNVRTIKVAPNGHVWIAGETATVGRLAEFDPSSGIWQERAEIGIGNSLEQSDSGDLWLINSHPFSLTRFSYNDPSGSARKIEFKGLKADAVRVGETVLAKDGSLWAEGELVNNREPVLMRYRSTTAKWTIFTYTSTLGAMPADWPTDLTALPDGSVFFRTFGGVRYRYAPDSTDSPTGGQWVTISGISEVQSTDVTEKMEFPSNLDGLIWNHRRLCKVK